MPIAQNWQPDGHVNVMLIGNSIIVGGDPFRQQDKLAPLIQKKVGTKAFVWPLAVGGWTEVNEMVYLDRHPELVKSCDLFAWEYMSGGLRAATPWYGEYTFPTHQPFYASWYVLRRYIIPKLFPFLVTSELSATDGSKAENISKFEEHLEILKRVSSVKGGGIIWLYPTRAETDLARHGLDWLPERSIIEDIAAKNNIKIIDIASFPAWDVTLYRADGVHPTVRGNQILATILSEQIADNFGTKVNPSP